MAEQTRETKRLGKAMTLRRERLGYATATELYEAARLEAGTAEQPHLVTWRSLEAGTAGKPRESTLGRVDKMLGWPDGTARDIYNGRRVVTKMIGWGLIEDEEEPDEAEETQAASEADELEALLTSPAEELQSLSRVVEEFEKVDGVVRQRWILFLSSRYHSQLD